MADYQLTCIDKPNLNSPHEHITHVGNIAGKWKITRELAIRFIESGEHTFHVVDPNNGKRAYVGVVRGEGNKAPYLKTHADGQYNNNLLSLSQCGNSCVING
jgi:hypothetical protein